MTKSGLGIVGSGRMARHVKHYFDLLAVPYRQWARRDGDAAMEGRLAGCDAVLLLVADHAIEPMARDRAVLRGKTLIHFSGSLVTPLAHGMHPLCTFADRMYEREVYEAVPFVCESGGPSFHTVFPQLPNPSYTIDPADKPLYHSVAVLAGNFSTVLWAKLFDAFGDMGLPREVAVPYLRQVHANLLDTAGDPHTGPLARGDRATVRRNLEALGADPFGGVYRAVVGAVTPELLDDTP